MSASEMTIPEALEILKPFSACMHDQWGCPISDAAIALDVVIEALEEHEESRLQADTLLTEEVRDANDK